MARGTFLGRSRTLRQAEGISAPVLKHSDAQPRKDLKCIEDGANQGLPPPPPPRDFHRPGTSESRHKKKLQALSPGLITQYPPLPASPISSPTGTDYAANGSLIGVALGSPRMIETHSPLAQVQVQEAPPVMPAEKPAEPQPQPRPTLQRKPSKWKKIGGLFKAKNALASAPNQPFYQVKLENEFPMQGSTFSFDPQPRAKLEHPASPSSELEAWPSVASEIQPTVPQPKQQDASPPNVPPQDKEQASGLGPLLHVDIPDIQLERYSVMFGGVLRKNRSSSVDRQSQAFHGVSAPDTDSAALPDLVPPPRRASSPTRSKSPSFTLFPATQVTKASKLLGSQNIPRGPSPIHKSQASLAESRQEDMSKEKNSVVLMVHGSHKPQNSMSSFLSSTTIGSDDEELLLQKLKPVRNYFDAKEPEWEIINRRTSPTEQGPGSKQPPKLAIDTQTCASSETAKSESIPSPANTPAPDHGPQEMKESASPTRSERSSPVAPKHMARRDRNSSTNNATDAKPTEPTEPTNPAPAVEISIARSVSVSRGRRQVLVPIRPRSDRLDPGDRPLDRRPPVPSDGEHHHHPHHQHHPPRPRLRPLRNAPVEMI